MLELEALQRENAELRGQITKLTEQLAKLTDRVGELLAVAQRRQRKPAAEKPIAPAPVVPEDAQRAFDERPKAPEKTVEPELPKLIGSMNALLRPLEP